MRGDWSDQANQEVINYLQTLKVGDKIKFVMFKQRYTIQARNERYIICTKPFNPEKTVLITIIDLERYCRGADNMIFGWKYETREKCEENLERLVDGQMEVAYRNVIMLDVEVPK